MVSNFVGVAVDRHSRLARGDGMRWCCCSVWKPKDAFNFGRARAPNAVRRAAHTAGELLMAWRPYMLLVIFVLAVGLQADSAGC